MGPGRGRRHDLHHRLLIGTPALHLGRRPGGRHDLGPRQVVDHRFRTAHDTIYGVRLSAPESTPVDELREPVTIAVTSLGPTGVTCVRG